MNQNWNLSCKYPVLQVVSKIDAVKKGGSMEEVGKKVAATRKALWHACSEWATRSSEL
jgi:hypothetical protein